MLIVMTNTATTAQIEAVCEVIRQLGFEPHPMPGAQRTAICITGNDGSVSPRHFAGLHGIRDIIRVSKPYKLTSNEVKTTPTIVQVGQAQFGAGHFAWIAGPACIEDEATTLDLAAQLAEQGVKVFRGSAYRSRTNPYNFQGLGQGAIPLMQRVREDYGLAIATEAADVESVATLAEIADLLIVDSHNMQNFALLRALGKQRKPVMLKRNIAATIEDFLMAAEYIMAAGNQQVILCEAGIQTFCEHSQFTLDLAIVPALQKLTHLPVVVDPTQAAGANYLVPPLALAAQAVGAHGVMVECHNNPAGASMGGAYAIDLVQLQQLVQA